MPELEIGRRLVSKAQRRDLRRIEVIAVGGLAERGNLAGSTLTLHAAVRNMIVRCGLSPETVIPMATSTPARSVGAQTYGAIAPGKAARFALMDREWNFLRAL